MRISKGCCVGLFFAGIFGGGGGGGADKVQDTYTLTNLNQRTHHDSKRYRLTQGRRVIVTVDNQDLALPNTDVDLFVFRASNNQPVARDTRIPAQDRHCRVEFDVPATGEYWIRVANLGPGQARRCVVRIEER